MKTNYESIRNQESRIVSFVKHGMLYKKKKDENKL